MNLINRLKYYAGARLESHPFTGFLTYRLLPYIPLLLPHDESYYAFKHLNIEPDGLFLDVGANNGISALSFRHLNKRARILSIEPNICHENALRRVRRKIQNFEYRLLGAGDTSGTMALHVPIYKGLELHTFASSDLEHVRNGIKSCYPDRIVKKIQYVQKTVDVVRLDDLNLSPDIVKIDAEGHDYRILMGLEQTIRRKRPSIFVEWNQESGEDLKTFCQYSGYEIFQYEHHRALFRPFVGKATSEKDLNVLLIPTEKVCRLPVKTAS